MSKSLCDSGFEFEPLEIHYDHYINSLGVIESPDADLVDIDSADVPTHPSVPEQQQTITSTTSRIKKPSSSTRNPSPYDNFNDQACKQLIRIIGDNLKNWSESSE